MLALRSSVSAGERRFINVHRQVARGQTLVFLSRANALQPRFRIDNTLTNKDQKLQKKQPKTKGNVDLMFSFLPLLIGHVF